MSRPASKRFLEALRPSRAREASNQRVPQDPPAQRAAPNNVTLATLRTEARRVYGRDYLSESDCAGFLGGPAFALHLRGGRILRFESRSKMAARRFAYEVLSKLPSAENGA